MREGRAFYTTAATECERGARSIRWQRQCARGARILHDGSARMREWRASFRMAAPECEHHVLQGAVVLRRIALHNNGALSYIMMCDIALREATVHYEVLCCTTRYYAALRGTALRCFRMPLLFGITQHELSYLGEDLRRIPYRPKGPEEVV